MSSETDAAIEAALVWDVRTLRALAVPGTDELIDAFGATPQADPLLEVGAERTPLVAAASGIVLDRAGDHSRARELYGSIAGDSWSDLLRVCLLAWSPGDDGGRPIEEAVSLVSSLPRSALQARLYAKLATSAYDKQHEGLFRSLLAAAVEASEAESRLGFVLRLEQENFEGHIGGVGQTMAGLPADPLVDMAWIEGSAHAAAAEQLSDALKERARNPWSSSVRFGRTPLDQVLAAELQASWAGALWIRRSLRRQAGAQVLLSEPADSREAAYGLLMWILGGGRDRRPVADLVEPNLDVAAIAEVLRYLLGVPASMRDPAHAVAEVAYALWDCVPEQTVASLFHWLEPEPVQHPVADDVRRLWAILALRAPETFAERLVAFDAQTQAAFVGELTPAALRRLPESAARSLLDAVVSHPPEWDIGDRFVAAAVLDDSLGLERRSLDLNEAPPDAIVAVAKEARERVTDAELERAAAALGASIRDRLGAAREGRYGFGTRSPEALLAAAIEALGGEGGHHLPPLLEVVEEHELPGEMRLEALVGLGMLASRTLLDAQTVERIRAAPLRARDTLLRPVSTELLEAARLLALARDLSQTEQARLIAFSRDRDPRVRELSVNAAALANEDRPADVLEYVLVSALFDPDESVLVRGLVGLRQTPSDLLQETVDERLITLVRRHRRLVRAGAASLARRLLAAGLESTRLAQVVELASGDKSWRVREAARSTPA